MPDETTASSTASSIATKAKEAAKGAADRLTGGSSETVESSDVSADVSTEKAPESPSEPAASPTPGPTPGPTASSAAGKVSTAKETAADAAESGKKSMPSLDVNDIRNKIAQVIWIVCVVCALILAAGALLVSLQGSVTNSGNQIFQSIVGWADNLDFGVLSRENGLFDFTGKNSDIMDALTNWGLAAIAWLVIGRLADRIIRP